MKKGLGKGLGALIGEQASAEQDKENQVNDSIREVDIHKIEPNKDQPRRSFDELALLELAHSIQEFGIIQPLIVKRVEDYFEIVAGERRWRAAKIAKLKTVPIIIKNYSDLETLEVSLIENIQREDLNPLEEALTYKRLADEYNLNQEDIANKVGKSRAAVANAIRLLSLDKRVQNFLNEGRLTTGHARALLGLDDFDRQFDAAEKIIEEQLNVRDTEALVKRLSEMVEGEDDAEEKVKDTTQEPVDTRQFVFMEKDLKTLLGTKVKIKNGKNKGKIEIDYYSEEELERLIGLFKTMNSEASLS